MRESLFSLLLPAVLLISTGTFGPAETDQSHLKVSGTTQGNLGCAILERHMPVKGKLLAVGMVYVRTEYKVVDTFNYKMPKSKFTGKGEIDELNRLAARHKVKLVVIPSKYKPEELDEARRLCGETATSSLPSPPTENHP